MSMPALPDGNQMSSSPSPMPLTGNMPVNLSDQSAMSGYPQADISAPQFQPAPGDDDYVAPMDYADVLQVLKRSYLDLVNNRDLYDRNDKYYRGISPEIFNDPQLRRLLGLSEDVYALNYAAIPVNTIANRMTISSINVPGDADATDAVNQIVQANRLKVSEQGFMVDTLKYGDNYMIVWPVRNALGDYVLMISPSAPTSTRLYYDPSDDRTKTHALKAWIEQDGKTIRADLYLPNHIYKFVSSNSGKLWAPVPEPDESWPMVNPFGQIPIFHFRAGNSTPYGSPEHGPAFGPQDGLVKTANTLFAAIDFLGFPQRYALTEMSDASGTAEFSDFDEDQPDAFITDDAGRTSGLRQGPGELWALRASQVGQFNPAPVDGFLKVWDQCIGAMSAATGTPMRFFTDPTGQHPSGDSLRAADQPLHQKIMTRQLTFEATYSDLFCFVLQLCGFTDVTLVRIDWHPLDTADDLEANQSATWKLRAGIPRAQVYRDMGYSEDQISSWGLAPADYLASPAQLWASAAAAVVAAGGESEATGTATGPDAGQNNNTDQSN